MWLLLACTPPDDAGRIGIPGPYRGSGAADTGEPPRPPPPVWTASELSGSIAATSAATSADAPRRVVIVGGGAAGLAAAMDLGGDVLLLDADTALGGRARWSGGFLMLTDTPELEAEGRAFSSADLIEDWEDLTGAPAAEATARYLEASSDVRDRLSDLGVAFALGHRDPVFLRYWNHHVEGEGPALVDAMIAGLPPSVRVRLGVAVTDLLIEGGRVVGVAAGEEKIPAEQVLIASGGFVREAALLARYVALPEGTWGPSLDGGAWGDALGWAEARGLGIAAPGAIGWNANLVGIAGADGLPIDWRASSSPPWIWVNGAGQRFVDETAGWSLALLTRIDAQDRVRAVATWSALTSQVEPTEVASVEAARSSGQLVCAADLAALARAVGVSPAGLTSTAAAMEAARPDGGPDELGRDATNYPHLDGEVCSPPIGRLAAKNYGGLATDGRGRVLDRRGRVVEGLYAAGEAGGMGAPGLGGLHGFDGSLGAVVWSGWVAADGMNQDAVRSE